MATGLASYAELVSALIRTNDLMNILKGIAESRGATKTGILENDISARNDSNVELLRRALDPCQREKEWWNLPPFGKPWRSCARWPHSIGVGCDDFTFDWHETEAAALAVTGMLKRDGLGGERCHFPVDTWVEKIGH